MLDPASASGDLVVDDEVIGMKVVAFVYFSFFSFFFLLCSSFVTIMCPTIQCNNGLRKMHFFSHWPLLHQVAPGDRETGDKVQMTER